MAFSLNLLTLTSEVDALLNTAQRDKRALDLRKQNLEFRTDNSAEDSVELSADLTAAQAELAASLAILPTLPEGERKADELIKKTELELKVLKLTRSGNKRSAIARIENEYDIDQLERQIAGIDAFIAELNARKAQL